MPETFIERENLEIIKDTEESKFTANNLNTVLGDENQIADTQHSHTGSHILINPSSFNGILSSADSNVQHAMQTLDDLVAEDITLDTTNFNGNLSSADNNVQHAMETLDNLTTGGLIPPGTITAYAALQAPSGWLLCNGASYSTSAYPDLYAVIGHYYGGSGNTFNVPDLRSRVPVCIGTDSWCNVLNEKGGAATHTLSISEMPQHRHLIYLLEHGENTGSYPERGSSGVSGSAYTEYQGGNTPHNNLQPYITLQYIIKY